MSEEAEIATPIGGDAWERVPWGFGEVLAVIAIVLLAEVVGSLVLGVGVVAIAGRGAIERNILVFNIVAYQFLVLGVLVSAVWLVKVRNNVGASALGYCVPDWPMLIVAVLTGAAAVFFGAVLVTALFHTFLPQYGLKGNAKQVLAGVHHHMPLILRVVTVLWAGVEAPLVEETLFRGIIFQGLRDFFDQWFSYAFAVFAAAIASGLLFGVAHFEPRTLPILFFVGIVLAYVFQYGRSVFASALVHGILNASVAIYILQSSG